MKLTSKKLKQMITEEISEGFFDRFFGKKEPEPEPEPANPHYGKTSFKPGEVKMLVKYYHIYDQAEVEREHRNQKPNQRHAVVHYDVAGVKEKSGKIINPSILDTFHDLIYHRQISSQRIDDQKMHERILLKRFILPMLNAEYYMHLDAEEFLRDHIKYIRYETLPVEE
tara:strand:+ start:1475 stop:1981 length:507 start_codon:yes stop_codon:yes gene_type:complete